MNVSTATNLKLNEIAKLVENNKPHIAEEILHDLIEQTPKNRIISRALGLIYLQQEKFKESITLFEKLVRDTDFDPVYVLDYVKALRGGGDRETAISVLTRTLSNVSSLSPGWFLLGDIFVENEQYKHAKNAYQNAVDNDPFRVQIEQVKRSINAGDTAKSKRILEHILEQDASHVEALSGMAVLAMQLNDSVETKRYFDRALTRTSYWPTLLLGLSQLFLSSSKAYEAKQTLQTLVQIEPTSIMAWNMLGTACELLMQNEEAITAYRNSLSLNASQPRTLVSIGNVQRILGQRELSERSFKDALVFSGNNGEAYWGLSNLKDYSFSDHELFSMQRELKRDSNSLNNAAPMYFAVAKAFEDRREFEKSFSMYRKGNALQKLYSDFDAGTYFDEVERIKQSFSSDFIAGNLAERPSDITPIFIVGMPRTGSTLVEQILSSHSQVEATMELPFIGQYARELNQKLSHIAAYPESVQFISKDLFDEFAARYINSSSLYRHGAKFFIDKMPNNFVHIGLIRLLFKNVKIIDVRRHPLDTCLSVYKQRFAIGQSYSYDLNDISSYFEGYRDLMDHWNRVFPGSIYTLEYERLVVNQEASIKGLLSYCGLEFEHCCLEPERNMRPIRTPSSEQVRKKIITDKIGHWKNFEKELSETKKRLRSLIESYESDFFPNYSHSVSIQAE